LKGIRTFTMEARASKEDPRVVSMAISSEFPVERYFGIEVLDHSPESVDLSRLRDGRHPLLLNHNPERQIGVLRSVELGTDKKMRGTAKFSRSALGVEVQQDVEDEIRTLVSVGYMIQTVREEKRGADGEVVVREIDGESFEREMRALYGDQFYRAAPAACRAKGEEEIPVYRVTRWVPFEASIVPIPADTDVGVGRAAGAALPADAVEDPTAGAETVVPKNEERAAPVPIIEVIKETIMENLPAPETLERERVNSIVTLAEQYKDFVDQKDINDAIRNGRSVEQFKDIIIAKMQSRHSDTSRLNVGMTAKEVQRYSLSRAIAASITGDWSKAGLEREASAAVAKLTGATPEGFFVPFDAFKRDFNVGTATEAGNLVATDLRSDLYVDALRNKLVVAQAGIRILAGLTSSIDIPRKATAGTLGMLTEIGSASETNPATAKVSLTPKRVGAYVEYSKQALIQSAMPLESMLRDDLLSGAATTLEDQVINGVGTGANMRGIRNTTAIGTVVGGTNGAAPVWSHFVDLESACANLNAEPDMLAGYLLNTKTRGKLKQTTKSTYLPWIWDGGAQPVNGYRALVTNTVPSNLTKGTSTTICSAGIFSSDYSMGVMGLFGAPDVTVDPYTKADTGQVKITLNQFADFGVRQPSAFSKIDDLLSN
jgi:HK97 family phage major capsid protein